MERKDLVTLLNRMRGQNRKTARNSRLNGPKFCLFFKHVLRAVPGYSGKWGVKRERRLGPLGDPEERTQVPVCSRLAFPVCRGSSTVSSGSY